MAGPTLEPSQAGALHFTIDRSLSVPVGVQLRGQIEYGIAGGEIGRGARLPSVRDLAAELGLAHMTVAQVYKDLLARGLIQTQPGRGTFVADTPAVGRARDQAVLRRLVARTVEAAAGLGFTPAQLLGVLSATLERPRGEARSLRVLLVGIFERATRDYAAELARLLPMDSVEAITIAELETGAAPPPADLTVTFAHREAQVRALLPGASVVSLGFIPSDHTRTALAALDPQTRLGVVATFEEFLPTLKSGVTRFAPHISQLRAAHLDSPELAELLRWSGVLVYATGAEGVLGRLPPGTAAFEYRHTPDPFDVDHTLAPLLDERREAELVERTVP